MATLKQRLHRKNSSGTYDTIHLETSADCITGTLGVAHGGTGRATLTSGYFLRGNGTGAVTMSSIDQVKQALGITASNPVIVKTGTIDGLQYNYHDGSIESVTLTACDYIVITNTHNTSYPQVTIAKGGSGIVAVYFPYPNDSAMTTTANLNSAGTTLSFDGIGSSSGQNQVRLYATYVTYKYE